MHSLPIFLRLHDRPVILLGEGPAREAKARLLARAGARIVGEEASAALAIVAIEDAAEAQAATMRLKARGILVNAVDRPELCDFTLPAIVDRAPVLLAIGTGGVSAGLAGALRQRLEAFLPDRLGGVADALHAARGALRARHPEAAERRRAIAALLAEGGALDPLVAHDRAEVPLDAAAPAVRLERIAIAAPDPESLTLRAARLLGQADRIYHPPDMAAAILDRARADAERIVGVAPASPLSGLSLELAWSIT